MTFEEFEKAKDHDLKRETKNCFDRFNDPNLGSLDKPAILLEAQFYMQELGRREDSRIASRDFLLEGGVIFLIFIEIMLSIYGVKLALKQGTDEDRLMDKQNAILTNLQNSTADTAAAMKGLAAITKAMSDATSASSKTLTSLRSTTETMNKGVQNQLSLFYDPACTITYDQGQNRIILSNSGRTGLTLTGISVSGIPLNVGGRKLISAGTGIYIDAAAIYNNITPTLEKGAGRMVPVEAHLENEIGKKFL
jgi:hypothetical protein